MSLAIEQLLRDLQGAVSARQLYPAEHPRVSAQLDQLRAAAEAATAERGALALAWLDDRLLCDGAPVDGGTEVGRSLFALLRKHGYHRLGVRHGLGRAELASFVEALATSRPTVDAPVLRSSDHVRLSAVAHGGGDGPAPSFADQHRAEIEQLWAAVTGKRVLEVDLLEDLGFAVVRTIARESAAFISLAAVRSHDDYTVTHISNVALLSTALAEAVGLPGETVRQIGVAALLHDVGKLDIPPEILGAKGRLTPDQAALIRRHPEDGVRILMETPGVSDLAVIVAFEHHLHFDGGGYPSVSRGWRRNVASAVTQVADVYDALRTNRPYRDGLPQDQIVEIMMRDAGTVFDPVLVESFFADVMPRAHLVAPDATAGAPAAA